MVAAALEPLLRNHEVATCGLVELEVLFSSLGYRDFRTARAELAVVYPLAVTRQTDFDRAVEVMSELARRGLHRSAGPVDLVIAAVAERNGLTVLHYDSDYDRIAEVTGQAMEWVVPRGSVP